MTDLTPDPFPWTDPDTGVVYGPTIEQVREHRERGGVVQFRSGPGWQDTAATPRHDCLLLYRLIPLPVTVTVEVPRRWAEVVAGYRDDTRADDVLASLRGAVKHCSDAGEDNEAVLDAIVAAVRGDQ